MNWDYGEAANVHCPVCSKLTIGLDWTLDEAGDTMTGATVFPCEDVIPMPPWTFGPTGRKGSLKWIKVG